MAEDNTINWHLTIRLLEARGHHVRGVTNGREGLAALAEEPFDIVLMDVQMPELDGFEATAAIRAHDRAAGTHTPAIALTADAMKGDEERCLAAGMDAYLCKPLPPPRLHAAILRLLAGAKRPNGALTGA